MLKSLKLYIRPDRESDTGFIYYVDDSEYTNHWPKDVDIHIGEVEVFFHPPEELDENELRLKAIQTLRDKQEKLRATAERDIQELERKIETMLLLTHQTGPDVIQGEATAVQ